VPRFRISGIALAVSVVLLVAGCGNSSGPSASTLLSDMQTAVNKAQSVHIAGTATQNGQTAILDVSLTKSGNLAGTIKSGATDIYVIVTGGKAYIKLNAAFLKQLGVAARFCAQMCGKYLVATGSDVQSITGSLSMSSFFKGGFKNINPNGAQVSGPRTINGQSAWAVTASDGTGYIASQGKAYLLRITSTSTSSGTGTLNFTQWDAVTIPPAPPASQIVDTSKLTG
jgi:hypothetical protein